MQLCDAVHKSLKLRALRSPKPYHSLQCWRHERQSSSTLRRQRRLLVRSKQARGAHVDHVVQGAYAHSFWHCNAPSCKLALQGATPKRQRGSGRWRMSCVTPEISWSAPLVLLDSSLSAHPTPGFQVIENTVAHRYFIPRPLRLLLSGAAATSCFVATLISGSQLLQARPHLQLSSALPWWRHQNKAGLKIRQA